jgi:nucleolar pre-ribosomal-associated protein 1
MITPVRMVSHCLNKMNAKKVKFLHILIELSSLHSSVFGHLFLGIVNISLHHDVGVTGAIDLSLSEDQFILLLPSSLSYLRLMLKRFGDLNHEDFKKIPYFYSKILLKGFSQWKSFLSKDIFEEEYGESIPSSVQELLCLIDCSLLGKSIHMLQYHFTLNGDSIKLKKQLKLFKSICPKSASCDELMDCDSQFIDSYSLCQSFNIINHVVAKISLCKMLVFHEKVGGDLKEVAVEMRSKLEASRIHFINILVDIWQLIVKKFSLTSDQSGTGKSTNISLLYNHLEVFVLTNILELAVEMQNDLIQSQSIPFLEQLIRSALLYRFSDPLTMKTLQVIVTRLNDGTLSYDLYLQLLLAHSQFAPTLHSVRRPAGSFLKPVSSILKCVAIPSLDQSKYNAKHKEPTTKFSQGPLEIVKFLWILLWTKARHTGLDSQNEIGINLKELHALLHHSYGATLSEIDLAIYNVTKQIESMTGSCPQNVELNSEAIEEWTRSQQRVWRSVLSGGPGPSPLEGGAGEGESPVVLGPCRTTRRCRRVGLFGNESVALGVRIVVWRSVLSGGPGPSPLEGGAGEGRTLHNVRVCSSTNGDQRGLLWVRQRALWGLWKRIGCERKRTAPRSSAV